jgi:hypothetical protein
MYLDSTEIRDLNVWIQEHAKVKHPEQFNGEGLYEGVGVLIKQTNESGIGANTFGVCMMCKEEKDVTNYSHW